MRISHLDLIASLMQTIERTLRPLLPQGTPCALLSFPSSGNVGDNAIWLGERRCLQGLGARTVYTCEAWSYSRQQLRARVRDGVILLQGGGNLGDLWPVPQRLREEVIADFPDNLIIQLPQTIYFRDRVHLARAREVFRRHPRLILLVRDRRSEEIARNEFVNETHLCPDMAFALGTLPRPQRPERQVLCLLRTDQESQDPAQSMSQPADGRIDWRLDPTALRHLSQLVRHGARLQGRYLGGDPAWRAALEAYDLVARLRLRRGCRLLSRGEFVVTDRLHGHILSLLLGIPHVVTDNNYGKLRAFYETWTKDCGLVRWADSVAESLSYMGRLETGAAFS